MFEKTKICLVVLTLFLLVAVAGCGSKDAAPANPENASLDLTGKVWIAHDLAGREIVGDEHLTLEFMADGTVKGHGGCDVFTGTYVLAGTALQFEGLEAGGKSCGPSADEQQFTYISFLKRVVKAQLDDGELELFMENNPRGMVFDTSGPGLFW
jgi:heat shock protein HslJ